MKLAAFDLGWTTSDRALLARGAAGPLDRDHPAGVGDDRPSSPSIPGSAEIEIDILNRVVRAGDSVVHLSGIEQVLLYLLASGAGGSVSREEILDASGAPIFVARETSWTATCGACASAPNDYRHPRSSPRPRQGYRFHPDVLNTGWDDGRAPASVPARTEGCRAAGTRTSIRAGGGVPRPPGLRAT